MSRPMRREIHCRLHRRHSKALRVALWSLCRVFLSPAYCREQIRAGGLSEEVEPPHLAREEKAAEPKERKEDQGRRLPRRPFFFLFRS